MLHLLSLRCCYTDWDTDSSLFYIFYHIYMEHSVTIAQLIAVVMAFVTVSLFVNPGQYQEIIKDL